MSTDDSRLAAIEVKVDQIHQALVGSADGHVQGLQTRFTGLAARVERLEAWGKWLAGVVTAIILAMATQAVRGH